ILPADTPLGADASQLLGGSDHVLDVEITPNRGDCLSHYGLARELSIYFGCPLKPLNISKLEADPAIKGRQVEISAKDACLRYLGRQFSELTIGPSPAWMT